MIRLLKCALAVVVGLASYLLLADRPYAFALVLKAVGKDQPCPWSKLIASPFSTERFRALQETTRTQIIREREDSTLGLELFRTAGKPFWMKKKGADLDGGALLAYVLAEQQWVAEYAPEEIVRPGDVVVDVGAHVGTFGADALRRGASKVVMVEPDPVNVECIRRNFAAEIASGKVVLIAEGAWSKPGTLRFTTGVSNSGTGSFVVREEGGTAIDVPVGPLDEMLRREGIDRVDFIKIDIEGAEREALRGATRTLGRWKPRLMMDKYHLPDDDAVLPRLIKGANPGYRAFCAVCSPQRSARGIRMVPYAVFFH